MGLVIKGKCMTLLVRVFANLLSMAVRSSCKLPMLGDIYYFSTSFVLTCFKIVVFGFLYLIAFRQG